MDKMKIEKSIYKMLKKNFGLDKDTINNIKFQYNKNIINRHYNILLNKKQKKDARKKAYKIWKKINKNDILIDRNLYNLVAYYKNEYITNDRSIKKFLNKKFKNDMKTIENWIMAEPFEYLKNKLSKYKETKDYFVNKNRNTSFWKRDLINLIMDIKND